MVSVDIKLHVYLAASGQRKITKHTRLRVKVFHLDTTATTSTRLYTQIVSRNAFFRALVSNLFFMPSQLLWLYLGRFFRAHKCLFCMKLTKKKWLACVHFRNMALHYDETQKTCQNVCRNMKLKIVFWLVSLYPVKWKFHILHTHRAIITTRVLWLTLASISCCFRHRNVGIFKMSFRRVHWNSAWW